MPKEGKKRRMIGMARDVYEPFERLWRLAGSPPKAYVLAQMVRGLTYLREALLRAGRADPEFRRKMFALVDKVVEGQALSPEDTTVLGVLLTKLREVDPDFRSRVAWLLQLAWGDTGAADRGSADDPRSAGGGRTP